MGKEPQMPPGKTLIGNDTCRVEDKLIGNPPPFMREKLIPPRGEFGIGNTPGVSANDMEKREPEEVFNRCKSMSPDRHKDEHDRKIRDDYRDNDRKEKKDRDSRRDDRSDRRDRDRDRDR